MGSCTSLATVGDVSGYQSDRRGQKRSVPRRVLHIQSQLIGNDPWQRQVKKAAKLLARRASWPPIHYAEQIAQSLFANRKKIRFGGEISHVSMAGPVSTSATAEASALRPSGRYARSHSFSDSEAGLGDDSEDEQWATQAEEAEEAEGVTFSPLQLSSSVQTRRVAVSSGALMLSPEELSALAELRLSADSDAQECRQLQVMFRALAWDSWEGAQPVHGSSSRVSVTYLQQWLFEDRPANVPLESRLLSQMLLHASPERGTATATGTVVTDSNAAPGPGPGPESATLSFSAWLRLLGVCLWSTEAVLRLLFACLDAERTGYVSRTAFTALALAHRSPPMAVRRREQAAQLNLDKTHRQPIRGSIVVTEPGLAPTTLGSDSQAATAETETASTASSTTASAPAPAVQAEFTGPAYSTPSSVSLSLAAISSSSAHAHAQPHSQTQSGGPSLVPGLSVDVGEGSAPSSTLTTPLQSPLHSQQSQSQLQSRAPLSSLSSPLSSPLATAAAVASASASGPACSPSHPASTVSASAPSSSSSAAAAAPPLDLLNFPGFCALCDKFPALLRPVHALITALRSRTLGEGKWAQLAQRPARAHFTTPQVASPALAPAVSVVLAPSLLVRHKPAVAVSRPAAGSVQTAPAPVAAPVPVHSPLVALAALDPLAQPRAQQQQQHEQEPGETQDEVAAVPVPAVSVTTALDNLLAAALPSVARSPSSRSPSHVSGTLPGRPQPSPALLAGSEAVRVLVTLTVLPSAAVTVMIAPSTPATSPVTAAGQFRRSLPAVPPLRLSAVANTVAAQSSAPLSPGTPASPLTPGTGKQGAAASPSAICVRLLGHTATPTQEAEPDSRLSAALSPVSRTSTLASATASAVAAPVASLVLSPPGPTPAPAPAPVLALSLPVAPSAPTSTGTSVNSSTVLPRVRSFVEHRMALADSFLASPKFHNRTLVREVASSSPVAAGAGAPVSAPLPPATLALGPTAVLDSPRTRARLLAPLEQAPVPSVNVTVSGSTVAAVIDSPRCSPRVLPRLLHDGPPVPPGSDSPRASPLTRTRRLSSSSAASAASAASTPSPTVPRTGTASSGPTLPPLDTDLTAVRVSPRVAPRVLVPASPILVPLAARTHTHTGSGSGSAPCSPQPPSRSLSLTAVADEISAAAAGAAPVTAGAVEPPQPLPRPSPRRPSGLRIEVPLPSAQNSPRLSSRALGAGTQQQQQQQQAGGESPRTEKRTLFRVAPPSAGNTSPKSPRLTRTLSRPSSPTLVPLSLRDREPPSPLSPPPAVGPTSGPVSGATAMATVLSVRPSSRAMVGSLPPPLRSISVPDKIGAVVTEDEDAELALHSHTHSHSQLAAMQDAVPSAARIIKLRSRASSPALDPLLATHTHTHTHRRSFSSVEIPSAVSLSQLAPESQPPPLVPRRPRERERDSLTLRALRNSSSHDGLSTLPIAQQPPPSQQSSLQAVSAPPTAPSQPPLRVESFDCPPEPESR